MTELAHKCYIIGIGWISDYFTKYPSSRLDIMYPAWKVPSHPYFITPYTRSEMRRKFFFTLFLYPFFFLSVRKWLYQKESQFNPIWKIFFWQYTCATQSVGIGWCFIYMYIYISQEDGVWKYVAKFRFSLDCRYWNYKHFCNISIWLQ